MSGDIATITLLLDRGADPNKHDMLGDGPLDIAMTMDIVELLLSRGAVQTKPFNTGKMSSSALSSDYCSGSSAYYSGSCSSIYSGSSGSHSEITHSKSILDDLYLIDGIKYKIDSEEKAYRPIHDIAREWEAIGKELGMKEEYLKKCAESNIDTIVTARGMIYHWIHSDKNATWTRLIAAMRDSGKLRAEATELETALLNKVII